MSFRTMKLVFLITFFIHLMSAVVSSNYCSSRLCQQNQRHIGCENNEEFGSKCPENTEVVPMDNQMRSFIVEKHNEARKGICDGNYDGLNEANRMIEVAWNDELAYLAELHAKNCDYCHDECRNTEHFKNVGQNIGMLTSKSSAPIDAKNTCGKILDSWLSQSENCDMDLIERFRSDSGSNKVGEFTQMIQADCGQVGCALVTFGVGSAKNVFLVCNYSEANVPNKPVYHIGPPCSACVAGCSLTTPGLCKTEEHLLNLNLNLLGLKLKLKLL